MPKFHVSKSVHIQKPISEVYAYVRDFRQWPEWSPWIITDPDCQLTYSDAGDQYHWEGKVTGEGEMRVLYSEKPNRIQYALAFLKPWKSNADVAMSFTEKDGGTEVRWSLDSALPFFLFFMRPMMVALIGMDYERGLNMLKEKLETGSVDSKLEFPGETTVAATPYVGIRTRTDIKAIGSAMESDLCQLGKWLDTSGMQASGKPFAIYHRWDPAKALTEYTIAFPLESPPNPLPDGFVNGELPACRTFAIRHTGSYKHLGNAWSAGINRSRNKIIAQSKKIPPFEIYETDPTETATKSPVTTVHFPLK